jgi:AraC family transcriptional regulator of adaptative response/methylated-DNA-[protein]-cysteine methyltransferase
MVTRTCRAIDAAENLPRLAVLARKAGLSPSHFHRVFSAVAGVTPRAYASARRTRRVQQALANGGKSVTEAIYNAGFASGGRFYETSHELLGMTPTDYRAGGIGTEIRFAVGECSLGSILVASTAKGVCAIWLGDDPDRLVRDLQDRFPRAALVGADPAFEETVARVIALVERPGTGGSLPLDVRGTAFQRRVWQALQAIPAGSTASYADIAARIGAPTSVRAVARACGANTLAVVIPCHRVVRTDGSLSGYRWGVDRKRALLDLEAKTGSGGLLRKT